MQEIRNGSPPCGYPVWVISPRPAQKKTVFAQQGFDFNPVMDTAVFAGIAGELGFQVADYGSCAFAGTGDLSLFLSRGRPLCTNRRIQVIYPAETGKKFLITYEKISLSPLRCD